jgi:hypothetical protein
MHIVHALFSVSHLWNISTFPQMMPCYWCDAASPLPTYVRE